MDCAAPRFKRGNCMSSETSRNDTVRNLNDMVASYFSQLQKDMKLVLQRTALTQAIVERMELQSLASATTMNHTLNATRQSVEKVEKSASRCQDVGCTISVQDVSSCVESHIQPLASALSKMQEPSKTAMTPRSDAIMKKFSQVLVQQDLGSKWSARKQKSILDNTVPPETTLQHPVAPPSRNHLSQELKMEFDSLRDKLQVVVEAIDMKPSKALANTTIGMAWLQNGSEDVALKTELKKHEDVLEELAALEPEQKDDEERYDRTNYNLVEDSSFASVFMFDSDVERPVYRVEAQYKRTGLAQEIARSDALATMTTAVVCLNAIWIGVEADHSKEGNLYDEALWIQVISQLFVIYFFLEWSVRFCAFRRSADAFKDGWFIFDTFMVATMVLDTWVMNTTMKVLEDSLDSGTHKVKIPTQPFRVLRLLKLTRMAKLMKVFPELVTMIRGLLRSFRAICSTVILLGLVSYTWSIIMFMLLGKEHEFNHLIYSQSFLDFRSVFRSMWTLIMDGTFLLDNAAPLMTQMIFHSQPKICLAGLIFGVYVFLTNVLILNMLIGVLCDLVSEVNHEQKAAQAIAYVKQVLLGRLNEAAVDGLIGRHELQKVMHESKAVLKRMGINELFLFQMEEMLYADSSSRSIPVKHALDLLLMCRSDNTATVETLAGGFGYLTREVSELRELMLGKVSASDLSHGANSGLRHMPSMLGFADAAPHPL